MAGKAGARAQESLTRAIDTCRRTGCPRLPTLNALARSAGVSRSVMWNAVRSLCAQGVIRSRRGSGIYVASMPSPVHEPVSRGRWRQVAQGLSRDIRRGRYRPGEALPGPKQLAEQFGVSYRTLRKATELLAGRSEITRYRAGYRVPFPGGGRHNGSLVMIARGVPGEGPTPVGPWSVELLRLLERQCAQARVSLDFVPFDYVNSRLHPTVRARSLSRDGTARPLAFVVLSSTVQNPDPAYPDNLLGLVPLLRRHQVPVVFIDETGERLDQTIAVMGGRLTVVSLSSTPDVGTAVGNRLIALGHSRVAYLSAHQESVWSRNRLAGLVAAMAAGGRPDAVVEFSRGDILDSQHLRPLRDRLGDLHESLTSQLLSAEGTTEQLFGEVLRRNGDSLGEGAITETVRQTLQPLFGAALSHEDITAWVGANDTVALAALEFLAKRRVAVPGRLSVVGFDDTVEAMRRRLTSYNVDCAGAVSAALHHALAPPSTRPKGQAERDIIPGSLVERATLSKPSAS